ncbi:DDE-type integrase/transposase/recombinase [Aduncisulcus paluster]|uniref:DDE-type integrase/transposase/recombinase n=1 Tax=Aduncisulcus paluster TaxID=2918883 RepID=A0ABQ5JX58_9EUKA|nr:DDE-type integrase/transposase/recombinase [Aduncisulcus paluster]
MKDLLEIGAPRDKKQLLSLLAMLNYYRVYISDFENKIADLRELERSHKRFEWTENHERVLREVLRELGEQPMLFFIDYSKDLFLRTDASDRALGGVLFQMDDKSEKPIEYVSKAFSRSERNWTINEKEAFAIKFCVEKLQHYLRGSVFTVLTDHKNLLAIEAAKSSKIQRWNMFLRDFRFKVIHVPGKDNVVPDALSRVGFPEELHVMVELDESWKEDAVKSQDMLSQKEKEFYKEDENGVYKDVDKRIIIPQGNDELKRKVMKRFHNAVVGHAGAANTVYKIENSGVTWQSIRKDVAEFVSECMTCQKLKARRGGKAPLMTGEYEDPFHTVSMDTMGPLPMAVSGEKYIIVLVDAFSKWVELVPVRTLEAEEAADALVRSVFARHGLPRQIKSDNGPQFANSLFARLTTCFEVFQYTTTPYHPEANGAVERVMRELKKHIHALLHDVLERRDWIRAVPIVQYVLNNTLHSAIGVTPHEMLFGRRLPVWRDFKQTKFKDIGSEKDQKSYVKYVDELTDHLKILRSRAESYQHDRLKKKVKGYSELDKKTWNPDGLYLIHRFPDPPKLVNKWAGPYEFLTRVTEKAAILRCMVTHKTIRAHLDDVKEISKTVVRGDALASLAKDYDLNIPYAILGQRGRGRGVKFEVQWYGKDEKMTTWESASNLEGTIAFEDYKKKLDAKK